MAQDSENLAVGDQHERSPQLGYMTTQQLGLANMTTQLIELACIGLTERLRAVKGTFRRIPSAASSCPLNRSASLSTHRPLDFLLSLIHI